MLHGSSPPRKNSLLFFQAEDGIRGVAVTGVQTCALPIYVRPLRLEKRIGARRRRQQPLAPPNHRGQPRPGGWLECAHQQIGRAACRESSASPSVVLANEIGTANAAESAKPPNALASCAVW